MLDMVFKTESSLNFHTTFLSRVISKACGAFPNWLCPSQLVRTKFPFCKDCIPVMNFNSIPGNSFFDNCQVMMPDVSTSTTRGSPLWSEQAISVWPFGKRMTECGPPLIGISKIFVPEESYSHTLSKP